MDKFTLEELYESLEDVREARKLLRRHLRKQGLEDTELLNDMDDWETKVLDDLERREGSKKSS